MSGRGTPVAPHLKLLGEKKIHESRALFFQPETKKMTTEVQSWARKVGTEGMLLLGVALEKHEQMSVHPE